ncbi:unnamed protein product [Brassica oleracea var. botrytis]
MLFFFLKNLVVVLCCCSPPANPSMKSSEVSDTDDYDSDSSICTIM